MSEPTDQRIDSDEYRRLLRRQNNELALQPYQVELLKLQRHLEEQNLRMIVLLKAATRPAKAALSGESPGT